MEIAAKKLLLNKYLRQECSPSELEALGSWMQEDDQDGALHAILNEAWDELQLYPELEEQVSKDIFEQVMHSTGIGHAPAPVAGKPKEGSAYAQWLFLAASMAVLLVVTVLARK